MKYNHPKYVGSLGWMASLGASPEPQQAASMAAGPTKAIGAQRGRKKSNLGVVTEEKLNLTRRFKM